MKPASKRGARCLGSYPSPRKPLAGNMTLLSGALAVVTNATDPLGRAIVEVLADNGATVIAHGATQAKLAACLGSKRGLTRISGDISRASVRSLLFAIAQSHGGATVVVNKVDVPVVTDRLQQRVREAIFAAEAMAIATLAHFSPERRGHLVNVSPLCQPTPKEFVEAYHTAPLTVEAFSDAARNTPGELYGEIMCFRSVLGTKAEGRPFPSEAFSGYPAPEQIAREILSSLLRRRPKLRLV